MEQPSGVQLAEPEFSQGADAFAGTWTFGAWDKDMLHRVVTVMNVYLKLNNEEVWRSDWLKCAGSAMW